MRLTLSTNNGWAACFPVGRFGLVCAHGLGRFDQLDPPDRALSNKTTLSGKVDQCRALPRGGWRTSRRRSRLERLRDDDAGHDMTRPHDDPQCHAKSFFPIHLQKQIRQSSNSINKTWHNKKMINENFQSTRGTDNSSKKLIDNK